MTSVSRDSLELFATIELDDLGRIAKTFGQKDPFPPELKPNTGFGSRANPRNGENMRRFMMFAAIGATLASVALSAGATAAPIDARPIGDAAANLGLVEQSQYSWGGHRWCWYDDGWQGEGWYWCGYSWRRGFGWGGGRGWHNWGDGGHRDRGHHDHDGRGHGHDHDHHDRHDR